MRITYVGPVPPYRGGISHTGARIIDALRGLGHEIDVRSWRAQYPGLLYPGRQREPSTDWDVPVRFELAWWSPPSWWRTGRAARRGDLLVFPWVTPVQAPAYRILLQAASPCPSVAIVHNPLPHERRAIDEPLTRRVLSRLRGAVVLASTAADQLRAWFPDLPLAVVDHPPNLALEPAELPAAPPFRLLFFGMVRPYKGLDVALDALVELRRRGWDAELTAAGEFWGPVGDWARAVAERGLDDAVHLRPGYVADAEVPELFAAHHLVVAPYRSATQSGIVPLAYAAGRAVAATDVGGLPEAVDEGITGSLAPPGDPIAFADAVERSLGRLEELSRGALAHRSSWVDVARAILRVAER